MADTIVSIENLTKTYTDIVAVKELTLGIASGQFVALLGPSGCGKTTLLRLLAGFETPDHGTIEINGRQVAGAKLLVPPEKRKVGMVFQSYALFPHLTVFQNIAYGLSKQAVKAGRVQETMAMVRLRDVEMRMPHELSGGQQQRVALARALAPKPDIILLDEPFSNLDTGLRVAVRREVRDILKSAGATTLFVTHDQEEALSLADSVAVMMDGKLEQCAPPPLLYQYPATKAVAEFLGEVNFLPGRAEGGVVTCELGRTPIHNDINGQVEVMIRPEELQVTLNNQGQATVVERQYFGHDQLLTCVSDVGTLLQVRLIGTNQAFTLGSRVDFSLPAMVIGFPVS